MGKILGIGLYKTGTTSLIEALNILGVHAADCFSPEAWRVLDSCDAITGGPIVTEFELLDQLFPDSKFICTTREVESWLESCRVHFSRPHTRSIDNLYRLRLFGTLVFDEIKFRDAYEKHHQRVHLYFANRPNDILFVDIAHGEGWKQLCPFLGKDIPNQDFPHKNRAGEKIPYIA